MAARGEPVEMEVEHRRATVLASTAACTNRGCANSGLHQAGQFLLGTQNP